MAQRVYKYTLQAKPGLHPVEMPVSATILHVEMQSGVIAVWARVTAAPQPPE